MTPTELAQAKDAARARARAWVRGVAPADAERWSAGVRAVLLAWEPLARARTVGVFDAKAGEPDLSPLIAALLARGVAVGLPRADWETGQMHLHRVGDWPGDMEPTRHGLRQPRASCARLDLAGVDVVLVPGLAFDAAGGRLGRGAGYYDRMLGPVAGVKLGKRPTLCGVGFAGLLVDRVPRGAEDVAMDALASEGGVRAAGVGAFKAT